jgi:hypothetical protein
MNKRHWFYIGIFCGAVFGFMAGAMAETVQLPIRVVINNICQMQDKVAARKICDERGWPCPCLK